MKKLYVILLGVSILGATMSCNKGKPKRPKTEIDTTNVSFEQGDSVLYGLSGSDGTDSVLDIIPTGKDPQLYNMIEAKKKGNIIGDFEIGDRIAIVLSKDKKSIKKAIDLTSLSGRWLKMDSLNDPNADGFHLKDDGSGGMIMKKGVRVRRNCVSWELIGGRLVLTNMYGYKNDKGKEWKDTFGLKSLVEDTLILRNKKREDLKYVRFEAEITK